ncbi:hypothetical protein ERO13_A11G319900v2 [Gossypium hirsutum]|uniref:Uncharacterized protein n=1 Tax=Gossypium hirsutum TaxID=3635 RepID=A0A1U8MHC0_GOSHI|nr:uncharacterized protein LOC107936748 [Gossypium hirsutum]KAG4177631.1 hypothetical protein ERO13_A11G319900v2 [Gossypium hirsutum]
MTNWSSLRGHRDIVMIPTPGAPKGADGQPSADHYQVNSSSSMLTGGKKRSQKAKGKGIKKQCLTRVTGGEESVGELTVEHSGKNLTDQINRRTCKVKEKHWDRLRNCPEVISIIKQIEEKWPLLSDLEKIKENRSEILTKFKAGRLKEDGAKQELDKLKERLNHVDGQLQELHKANNLEELNKVKNLEEMFLNEDNDLETLQKEYYSIYPRMKEVVAPDDHGSLLIPEVLSKMNELENEIYAKDDNKVNVQDFNGLQQALNKNFKTCTDARVKAAQAEPHDNKGEDVEGDDSVPPPAQAPPQYPIFSAETLAILNVLGSLRDDISGIRDEVRGLGARMSTLEKHIAYLMFQFSPPQPPQYS